MTQKYSQQSQRRGSVPAFGPEVLHSGLRKGLTATYG